MKRPRSQRKLVLKSVKHLKNKIVVSRRSEPRDAVEPDGVWSHTRSLHVHRMFQSFNVCCRGDCDTSSPTCASRCHVCGFETDGRALFQSHMTEHRQWERGSFSLHCCVCDHSTNQEAEMRAHANTHMQGNMGAGAEMRWARFTCVTDAGV